MYGFDLANGDEGEYEDEWEEFKAGVREGRYPYCTLSVARSGLYRAGIVPELLKSVSAIDIGVELVSVIFLLLGRDEGSYVFCLISDFLFPLINYLY